MSTEIENRSAAEASTEPDATSTSRQGDQAVVFFDGVCGLCNSTVDFVMARDERRQFLFAPLQGETAQRELEARDIESLSSMALKVDDKVYRASSAVSRMLWRLGGVWSVLGGLLWLIPWPIRHVGYKSIAALRYKLFGKKESCRMPTPEERERFLP